MEEFWTWLDSLLQLSPSDREESKPWQELDAYWADSRTHSCLSTSWPGSSQSDRDNRSEAPMSPLMLQRRFKLNVQSLRIIITKGLCSSGWHRLPVETQPSLLHNTFLWSLPAVTNIMDRLPQGHLHMQFFKARSNSLTLIVTSRMSLVSLAQQSIRSLLSQIRYRGFNFIKSLHFPVSIANSVHH
jgi:hypothetical protein